MASAKIAQNKVGDTLEIKVTGYIGENAELFDVNFVGVKRLVMDLSGVNYINSVGVKNWINWTGKFPQDMAGQVINCPVLIVNQVNMVAGFLRGTMTVDSLFAPFMCGDCNREETVLLRRGEHYQYATMTSGYSFTPPQVKCPKCGKPMEFDGIEGKFFNFLKSIREPTA